MLFIQSKSPQETFGLGYALAAHLQAGDVLCLEGDLGAGKTLLAQGIGKGLGATDEVTSPTFTILQVYDAKVPIYHFDLYRLSNPAELFDVGFEEYTGAGGIAIIEWPDLFSGYMPSEHLRIEIRLAAEEQREIYIIPHGVRYRRLCEELKQNADFGAGYINAGV